MGAAARVLTAALKSMSCSHTGLLLLCLVVPAAACAVGGADRLHCCGCLSDVNYTDSELLTLFFGCFSWLFLQLPAAVHAQSEVLTAATAIKTVIRSHCSSAALLGCACSCVRSWKC
jgi:hypothetical protein